MKPTWVERYRLHEAHKHGHITDAEFEKAETLWHALRGNRRHAAQLAYKSQNHAEFMETLEEVHGIQA